MPSYLVIAAPLGEESERRFEYEAAEPLGPDSIFRADGLYKVCRVLADYSGRYDGLIDADQLVA